MKGEAEVDSRREDGSTSVRPTPRPFRRRWKREARRWETRDPRSLREPSKGTNASGRRATSAPCRFCREGRLVFHRTLRGTLI